MEGIEQGRLKLSWYECRGLVVSMCAGSDGQGTSGLKMEPKCITTDSDIGTGKPLCAPTGGRSIVREIQCAEGKDTRRSE